MGIKEKPTKRQKVYKKKTEKQKNQNYTTATEKKNKKNKKKKNESAEAWTRTAFLPGNPLVYSATEENTTDYVKNIILKAYFWATVSVTAVESWSSRIY